MNTMTSHNNDLQWPQTTIPANAVASILIQSVNDAIPHCKAIYQSEVLGTLDWNVTKASIQA